MNQKIGIYRVFLVCFYIFLFIDYSDSDNMVDVPGESYMNASWISVCFVSHFFN